MEPRETGAGKNSENLASVANLLHSVELRGECYRIFSWGASSTV